MLSLFSLIRQGDPLGAIIVILSRCFVVFCCLPIHELAHGLVAYKLGDDTAKKEGRLTLNPLAHLDPIGAIMIFLFGIGYARPVPVNIGKFKKPKQGMALTALAGPVSNILMAFLSVFLYYFTLFIVRSAGLGAASSVLYIASFFQYAASVNIMLAVFNLIPIPPLDGSRILNSVLSYKAYYKLMQYERYFMLAVFVILITGLLNAPISFLSTKLLELISIIPRMIFGF